MTGSQEREPGSRGRKSEERGERGESGTSTAACVGTGRGQHARVMVGGRCGGGEREGGSVCGCVGGVKELCVRAHISRRGHVY